MNFFEQLKRGMLRRFVQLPWVPYPENGHELNDMLVIGRVERFVDGPCYAEAMDERLGAINPDENARRRVIHAIVDQLIGPIPTCNVRNPNDGFAGTVQGYYVTREGEFGLVVQQDGTKVVHVYREKWLEGYEGRMMPPGMELQERTFQERASFWLRSCFSSKIASDKMERGDRLLEEVLELLQSGDYPPERVNAISNYVYERKVGSPEQEVGGVMVTLAAYCATHELDMHQAAEYELARISTPEMIEKIRAKQATKPTGEALVSKGERQGKSSWIERASVSIAKLANEWFINTDVPDIPATVIHRRLSRFAPATGGESNGL